MPITLAVKQMWARRYQMTQQFDLFQWQKLFRFGIGSIAYMVVGREMPARGAAWTTFCVVAGGLWLFVWGRHAKSKSFSLP